MNIKKGKTKKCFQITNSKCFSILTYFFVVFFFVLIGNTLENHAQGQPVMDSLSRLTHYVVPAFIGFLAGIYSHFIWTKKQEYTTSIKTLLDKENGFKNLFYRNSSICLIVEPISGRIFDANESALHFYEYSHREITSMLISDINIIFQDEATAEMRKALQSTKKNFQFQHRIKSGVIKHVNLYSTPIVFDKTTFLFSIIHDVTESVETEALNNLLKHSLDVSTDGIYWMNSDNRFIYVNEAGGKAFGCKPEELLGKHLRDVNPTTTNETLADLWYNLRTHGSFTAETVHRRLDGSEFYVEIRTVYLNYEGKEYNNGYARDITKRKLIEKELIKAKEIAEENERKLRLSEEKLRVKLDFLLSPQAEMPDIHLTDILDLNQLQEIQNAFAKATGVASVITDANGNPITEPSNFNGFCQLIRKTEVGKNKCILSDRMIGHKVAALKKPVFEKCQSCGLIDSGAPIFVGDKLIAIWMAGQIKTGDIGKTQIEKFAVEFGINKAQLLSEFEKMEISSLNQFEETIQLLWIFAKELSSLAYSNLVLSKKIEEQKEYESNLLIAKNKAEESDRLKTAFLHNMNHEIRTPLNAIIGFSQLLADSFNDEEKLNEYTNIIKKCSNDLLRIINDVLHIARIESAQLVVSIEPYHISDLFAELHRSFNANQIRREKQDLSFQLNIDSCLSDETVWTDSTKLKQIFFSLIDNAFKFTDNGKIEVGYKSDKDYGSVFYVSDTGIGIPSDKYELIFDRFIQLDNSNSRLYGGNGLGLSIVKGLVQLLGGNIWLESEMGKGSTFYFTIGRRTT
jgi:PAS domain S-box-containing protein